MTTKAYHRLVQRVEYYEADLELCDLLVRQFFIARNSDASVAEALGSTNDGHPYLGRRKNVKKPRSIFGTHLKHTLQVAFIKDLFEDFSAFLAETMSNAAMKGINSASFVGDIKLDIRAKDLLAAGSWDAAVRLISDTVFRRLENERNTRDLIRKASDCLGLQIDQATLDAAMPFLDARHIFVHRDGVTDLQYRNDYQQITLNGNKIVVNFTFVSEAKQAVRALALGIDNKIISADLVRR